MSEPSTPRALSLLRRALPQSLLRAIRVYRGLDATGRATLPRVWLRRLFPRRQVLPRLPSAPNVLFVCRGNILRSAVAEAMLTQLSRTSNGALSCLSASAGTAAADGSQADPRGIKVARELGIDLSGHRSRPLGQDAVDRADLILVMDYLNEADVLGQFPAAASKVRLLGSFGSGRHRPQEIRDPFSGTEADVRAAFVLISAAVKDLVSSISLAQAPSSGNSRTGAA